MRTTRELFEHELKDLYDAELKLIGTLKQMASAVTDPELVRAFERHRDQTQRQKERLEKVFDGLGTKPARETCKGIDGLIEEFNDFVSQTPTEGVLNAFAAGAARKMERYEIVCYESLVTLSNELGLGDAVARFKENLAEERATADELDAAWQRLVPAQSTVEGTSA